MTQSAIKLSTGLFLVSSLFSVVSVRAQAQTVASDPRQIAVVQCDSAHDQALVRFGLSQTFWSDNANVTDGVYAPIPVGLEKAWTAIPYQLRGQCHFKDGQTLALAYDGVPTGRGDDWGEGTMNVSLTINGHLAYDLFPIQHSNLGAATPSDPYNIDAILFDGTTLQEYDPAANGGATDHDVSQRLRPNFVYTNEVEAAFWKKQREQTTLAEHLSTFCKSFDFSESYLRRGRSWKLLSPDMYKQPLVKSDDFLSVTEATFDINNSGKPSPVFYIDYGADDNPENSVFVAFTKNPALAEQLYAEIKSGILFADPEILIPSALASSSVQIGRQMASDEYKKPTAYDTASMNVPFNYNGITYIYSYTDGIFVEPASRILEMKPDNSVEEICQFP
jgi:hypothetical protein